MTHELLVALSPNVVVVVVVVVWVPLAELVCAQDCWEAQLAPMYTMMPAPMNQPEGFQSSVALAPRAARHQPQCPLGSVPVSGFAFA
jgi:hypothetical protein